MNDEKLTEKYIKSIKTALRSIRRYEGSVRALTDPSQAIAALQKMLSSTQNNIEPAPFLVGIKDNIQVAELPTKAGTEIDFTTGIDATVVSMLRKHGAKIIGKTTTAQMGLTHPSKTKNPLDYRRTPGGSSQGSAVGAKLGYFDIGVGTQTVGSVVRPAAYCGLAAFVPTYGSFSHYGIVHTAPSLDNLGFISRRFETIVNHVGPILRKEETARATRSVTLAAVLPSDPSLIDQAAVDSFSRSCQLLENSRDIAVIPAEQFYDLSVLVRAKDTIVRREFYDTYSADPRVDFSNLALSTAQTAAEGKEISAKEYRKALSTVHRHRERTTAQMTHLRVDAWITPAATGIAPLGLSSTGSAVQSLPWSLTGMPMATVSADSLHGMPLGVQLIGAAGADGAMLDIAHRVEGILHSSPNRSSR